MAQRVDIRKRARSIGEISQMTRAMHLISAVKMKRARTLLTKTLPFFELVRTTIARIRLSDPDLEHPWFSPRRLKKGELWKTGYFILTGDQGLAGAYNLNLLNAAQNHIRRDIIEKARQGLSAKALLYVAGSIGKEILVHQGFEVVQQFEYPIDNPTYFRARDISDYMHDLYDRKELDEVVVIFTYLNTAMDMKPRALKLIPVDADALLEGVHVDEYTHGQAFRDIVNIEYFPSAREVLNHLVVAYLRSMVYGALTESFASEQTARMIAMDHATENAEEMLEKLRLEANRVRQAAITQEISEVVGGAEILAGDRRGGIGGMKGSS